MGDASRAHERESRTELYEAPSTRAPVRTLLLPSLPLEILRMEDKWVQVRQGDLLGWITAEELGILRQPLSRHTNASSLPPLSPPHFFPAYDPAFAGGSLFFNQRVEDLFQDRILVERMNHPFYRDHFFQFHRRWGFVYYTRTKLFYLKGIRLIELAHHRLCLNLVKRRIFYRDMYGDLWPEEILRDFVRSQQGLLGSELLFGKGQEYYLELALVF